ncbi:tRNA (adenosine(37)-N6)-threonylcarbamoyltransferase complex ATPase subunit type 1 TsaE [Tenuifilum thalassicum]|jgi:tRNA threonylcarbamoyladenosine biosynthesis protein TsaE|uniref:tRNA threonylcarbamoyladenosine biosynthesis protein TsaE n=1 Tax=Tenuifilum thalassicum TaxID=2590900 RepID=A0A7D3XKW9_9BACT|nr:tRNA (adenosine(37)-N6)-threonylcarbamoyltransferase complex ATPase subunit type 1 TsaE [Tenuifilum thalassicum]QKG78936.1 tRNA (adenosine(37)-N6)-threonylcarbamoyltransferase complex ATPase subunit type 1 TsaE [Tenuifilum thalassicum]
MDSILLKGLNDIDKAASKILSSIGENRIICFYGEMGAGKTTLIREICKKLGVTDVVTSPTFALVNEYTDENGTPVYHFDFYRIKQIDEVFDFGYEEYFYNPNAICLIEWPELVEPILPSEGVVDIYLKVNQDSSRVIEIVNKTEQ